MEQVERDMRRVGVVGGHAPTQGDHDERIRADWIGKQT